MRLVFLTPSPDPPGGGQAFNAGLIGALGQAGHTVELRHDAGGLADGATPILDGLLLPDLEAQLGALVDRDAVVVVHHVSARAGRDEAARERVHAIERRMLPAFRRVIATSAPVAERLATDFAVTATVMTPGLDDLPRSAGSTDDCCRVLCVGVLTPRKGQDRLLRMLARLTDLNWHLTIAGDAERDPVHAAAIPALAADLELESRLTLLADPTSEVLEAAWRATDLFALATRWEGYPAGIAEALRRGVPVVTTAVGGIPAMVPQAAGVLCPADDPVTFGKCLRRAIFDRELRAALAEGAWQTGLTLPGWPQQALAFEAILRS